MFDDDEWEETDELPSLKALDVLLSVLKTFDIDKNFGIGTDGRGSITIFNNRFTIEFLPSGEIRHYKCY